MSDREIIGRNCLIRTEAAEVAEKEVFCLSGGTDKQNVFPPEGAEDPKAFGESASPDTPKNNGSLRSLWTLRESSLSWR